MVKPTVKPVRTNEKQRDMKDGIIHISEVKLDFKCPKCEHPYTEDDYLERLLKSDSGFITMKCKGCKSKLGITQDTKANIVIWIEREQLYKNPKDHE